MTDYRELNRVFMQVGELVGSMKALHEKIDHRAAAAEKQSDLVRAELRNVKDDLRELEQKNDEAVHLLAIDVSMIKKSQDEMAEAVNELRKPVQEIMTLRARAMGAFLVLGPIGAAALYFIPEAWRAIWKMLDLWLRGHGQ